MSKNDVPPPTEADADFSEAEIARRRDAVIRKMLATPPEPQKAKKFAAKKKKRAPAKA